MPKLTSFRIGDDLIRWRSTVHRLVLRGVGIAALGKFRVRMLDPDDGNRVAAGPIDQTGGVWSCVPYLNLCHTGQLSRRYAASKNIHS